MESFSEFGFAGLVTGALLAAITFLIKWFVGYMNTLTREHRSERKEWREHSIIQTSEHREERGEWRKDQLHLATIHEGRLEEICKHLRDCKNAK